MGCHGKVLRGEESDFGVIAWNSFKPMRLSESSLRAESSWSSRHGDERGVLAAGGSALVIDAKALYDAAQKESITSFQDRRTAIEGLALRERMEATNTQW